MLPFVNQSKKENNIIKFIKKLLKNTRAKHLIIDASYIIQRTQHNVSKTDISLNALNILNRLNGAGFQAYLVGGSVRDLLLHKAPKDFDIATNATPNQIKNLFRNARIIGRRFKLVHIIFHREIIEVATFRKASESHSNKSNNQYNQHITNKGMLVSDNIYGSLEEDAWRRDFTVNSLYYNIEDSSIIDFTGGVQDIHQRILRIVGEPIIRYQEDPVRMLRAIRFCAKLQFTLASETAAAISQLGHLISDVSGSRLFDEVSKLYHCGAAQTVHSLLIKHKLFPVLFEQTTGILENHYPVNQLIAVALENTDARVRDNKPVTVSFLLAVLLWFPLQKEASIIQKQEDINPLSAFEQAMSKVIVAQNKVITIPRRFSQVIREIWLLQFRFHKRFGNRAFTLLQHPRFRAAFDFLVLRALAGDESVAIAQWWNKFQEANEQEQINMVKKLSPRKLPRPNKNKKFNTDNE